MTKYISRYTLEVFGSQAVKLPKGAEILTVQTQFEKVQLWALADRANKSEERVIEMIPTGKPIYCDLGIERKYISTFQSPGGDYAFHVFERIS